MIGGVRFLFVPGTSKHLGSQTIKGSTRRREANDRTYPLNKEYHYEKWGGEPRGERFETPYDVGGDPSVTVAPKLSRLREMAW